MRIEVKHRLLARRGQQRRSHVQVPRHVLHVTGRLAEGNLRLEAAQPVDDERRALAQTRRGTSDR